MACSQAERTLCGSVIGEARNGMVQACVCSLLAWLVWSVSKLGSHGGPMRGNGVGYADRL